ncbi:MULTISPECIES: formate dehydrogenase accessory sulfurtransferase FdhD [Cobetia]|jgi:FdhD protein|uniref:formate dehydrogenase accessory sulfurtransferase FdhD n=1 Tax=Cobetia TaxID=204286 RepID=UPI001BC95E94|nr:MULTISPECIES: formate dehydrogenase accessory sulfurtransferase FdhD [Cobetia]MBS4152904.1 formate dehydrogenase accessory sulfurtransferase FdhD [Cobetia sp. MC34]MBU3007438.1 formate dehydrogenase accessory sulfurtransferase FdhD [Cobetia amphilecti]|tara:strand:- start:1217 stop:2008 length:792 start_codon:yes stop_codon:yes gene_type:complete
MKDSLYQQAPGAAGYADAREVPLRELDGPSELPVSLALNDTAMGTLLASPEALEPLALGHAFTAGWITRRDEVSAIHLSRLRHGLAVRLEVSDSLARKAERHQRRESSVSSCGACGVQDEAELMAGLMRLPPRTALAPDALMRGLERLERATRRGMHLALGLDAEGGLISQGADIGRHNALDRVIGMSLDSGVWPEALLVSSRCSLELVQKTIRARIPTLITLAVPSRLAVETARACDLNLICAHRGRRLELLSGHADRPRSS